MTFLNVFIYVRVRTSHNHSSCTEPTELMILEIEIIIIT